MGGVREEIGKQEYNPYRRLQIVNACLVQSLILSIDLSAMLVFIGTIHLS